MYSKRKVFSVLAMLVLMLSAFNGFAYGQSSSDSIDRIVFVSKRTGKDQIYIMDADGGNVTRITQTDTDARNPAVSPDATKIVFSGGTFGSYQIYTINMDGTGLTQLTNNDVDNTGPSYSPDGKKIAFSSWIDPSDPNLYTMDADGSNLTLLQTNTEYDLFPIYSPDGTRIVFASSLDFRDVLYTVKADGTDVVLLTPTGDQAGASWSPDGSRIIFNDNPTGNANISTMKPDGTDIVTVASGSSPEYAPKYSPDGQHIVFFSTGDGDDIFSMNADGTGVTRLTNDPAIDNEPVYVPHRVASACAATVGNVDELTAAITQANDETKCSGTDTITISASFQLSASHDGGETAFPTITSPVTIEGASGVTISRDPNAPAFRFFAVDGTNGNNGQLTLRNLGLMGGSAVSGGAVSVDASGGGKAGLTLDTVVFTGNKATENGGAVFLVGPNGGEINAVVTNSTFTGNEGFYGGAFYSGAFDGGTVTAQFTNTNFDSNKTLEGGFGGAIYNNGQGSSGNAKLTLEGGAFTNNTASTGGAIVNDGHRGGKATIGITGTTFTNNSATTTPSDAIYSLGSEGYSEVTWDGSGQLGTAAICISDDTGVLVNNDQCS